MIEESRVPFLRRPRMKPELANGDGVSEGGRTDGSDSWSAAVVLRAMG